MSASSFRMGYAAFRRGEYEEAAKHYCTALRENPVDLNAHFNFALLLKNNLNEPDAAMTHFR